MHPALSNILLSFLNPESRRINGLYERLSVEDHQGYLSMALNLAILLCAEYTVVSPGVFLECPIAGGLVPANREYFDNRLIRLPLRETSLESLLRKKHVQYAPFSEEYEALYSRQPAQDVLSSSGAFINKELESGRRIAEEWEAEPDLGKSWSTRVQGRSLARMEIIRRAPALLLRQGLGITWPALRSELGPEIVEEEGPALRKELQREYLRGYVEEFKLRTLTNLPYEPIDLSVSADDLCYDYDAVREGLSAAGLWPWIVQLSPVSMIRLRLTYGFRSFRLGLHKVLLSASSARDVGLVLSRVYHDWSQKDGARTGLLQALPAVEGRSRELLARINLKDTELKLVEDQFEAYGNFVDAALQEFSEKIEVRKGLRSSRSPAGLRSKLEFLFASREDLVVLHLSDLHCSLASRSDLEVVLEAFWLDLEGMVESLDLVVVSGDLSFSGKTREFVVLEELLLLPLMDRFSLEKKSFFWVPGNHDVDRVRIARIEEAGLVSLLQDRESCNKVLDTRDERRAALKRLGAYGKFTLDFFGEEEVGREPEYYVARISELKGMKIGIACLNSAWRCSGDSDKNLLWIGDRQLQAARKEIAACDLKLAIVHHPPEWLHAQEKKAAEDFLLREFDILLRGHLHEPGPRVVFSPDGRCLIIPGAALFQGRSLEGYSVLRLGKRPELLLRRYFEERQRFDMDVMSSPEGRFEIPV